MAHGAGTQCQEIVLDGLDSALDCPLDVGMSRTLVVSDAIAHRGSSHPFEHEPFPLEPPAAESQANACAVKQPAVPPSTPHETNSDCGVIPYIWAPDDQPDHFPLRHSRISTKCPACFAPDLSELSRVVR